MSVVIETTLGDMTVDLFVEERPNTCLNFLKLCKIKYYNFCLFHTVQHNFIAQTGDPTGTGKSGESVYSKLYGEKAKYYEAEAMPKLKHSKSGLVSMVNCGNNMLGSQFFFTLSADLQSLDGQHCVFGEVVEGHDTLLKLNETICDLDNRPYQDIRIKHTVILVDPYDDPVGLPVPDASPLPSAETLANGRIGPDEQIDETQGLSTAEVDEMVRAREAKAQATILEIVGDIPDADVAPPENVLFVCKLNPVTSDDDLEIIFSRFGRVKSCEVIRDKKTGDSLQYAFVEFEDRKACEEAYFKMDNVLIDDRRIHVDFSQSVSMFRWKGKGRGVEHVEGKEEPRNHKYTDRRHSPETSLKKEDTTQHDDVSGSPQVRSAELQQGNPRDSPDPYTERSRKDQSRESDKRERSRNSEREKYRSDRRTHSSDRDHRRRTDDSDRSRRGSEKKRESSRERERQRRNDDADRDRHRRDRKRDSDHEKSRGDRSRDSDHERSRGDRAKDSDRERSRSDRTRDSDRERSRSDRIKDSEFDRSKNSRSIENSDKSKGDKKSESKSKEIKKEVEGNSTMEKESAGNIDAGNVERRADKDKLNKDVACGKVSKSETNKTDGNPSQSRKLEENITNVKPTAETDKKKPLVNVKKCEKEVEDICDTKQNLESHTKENSKGNKSRQEEKQKEKLNQSDSEETVQNIHNEYERKSKLEGGDDSHWQKKYDDGRHKREISYHRDHHSSRINKTHVNKLASQSDDKSDADDVGSNEESGSEPPEHDEKPNKPLSRSDDKEIHQNDETSCRKARNGSDTEDSQDTADEDVSAPSSKKRPREHVRVEKARSRNKRRLEQSPHSVKKKRWRKQSSSSSDSDSSSSESSSESSDSSSDSTRNSKAKMKKNLKKHGLPMKKIKKLKVVKKKKKRLRHRKHSESDSSSESSDSSDYKKKYLKLKKKKKRKNVSSDDSSSEDEVRKRRERKKKSKQKKKPSSSEDSDEESESVSSDASYHKLLKKHRKRLAAEKKAKKSKRELKLNKKKNYVSRKRQHSEPEEQSSSDESTPIIAKKDSKKSNGVEGKKLRKEAVADLSS